MAMKWDDAIEKVLKDYGCPMNYEVIAKEVIRKGYRSAPDKDPKYIVNSRLTTNRSRFMSLGNGKFMLVDKPRAPYINSKYKHLSDYIEFPDDISPSEKELLAKAFLEKDQLLDLIVNFNLPLVKGKVCFADILEKMGKVEFSNEEKKRTQWVDAALLRRKVEELKQEIENLRNEGNGPENQDLDAILRSLYEALKKTSEGKVKVSVPLLGVFVKSEPNPKIVIYYKNIQRIYGKKWESIVAGVFVHEMFHAWNYFKAGRKSRSVLAIDEPMVEFESLYFLKKLEAFTHLESHHLDDKVESVIRNMEDEVLDKQQSIGDVAAYGLGYYLFNNLKDYDYESIQWIETYSRKSDSINKIDWPVYMAEEALIPVYPIMSEEKVMERFKEIIFEGYANPATAGTFALRKIVLACIETIGRKCFDVQELYAFAPIFKACMPHYLNLEEALKQQLDELVKDRILEDLAHDCYCVKLD